MEKQTVAHSSFSLIWRKRNQRLAGYASASYLTTLKFVENTETNITFDEMKQAIHVL